MESTPIISNVVIVNPSRPYQFVKRLFFVGLCILGISLVFRYFSRNPNEYLIFCQEYPISVCLTSGKGPCKYGSDNYSWPVHGIWPTFTKGNYPQYCQKIRFDVGVLQPIVTDLNAHWYSIYDDNAKFWDHEWSKHGTCAVVNTPLKTQFNYFNQGLQWNSKYPIKDILERHDIIPRDEKPYSIDAIYEALVSELGVQVGLACKKQQIIEVRLCFSMDLKLINCNKLQADDCDDNELYYPKTAKKFVEVEPVS